MVPRESQQEHRNLPRPELFRQLVRDALLHLYDLAYLQTHPLLLAMPANAAAQEPSGKLLRRELLDAIETLRPASGIPAGSHPWRLYRILELRYIAEEEVAAIRSQLIISKSEYHREHQRALSGIAALLRERWHVPNDWDPNSARLGVAQGDGLALIEDEVIRLQQDRHASSFDPVTVTQNILGLLAPLCEQNHVEVHTEFPAVVPSLSGDQILLRHTLLMLLTHAVIGGRVTRLNLRIAVAPEDVTIAIVDVADDQGEEVGAGIEECRPFVEKLGGRVELTRAGSGLTTISLSMPRRSQKLLLVVDNNAEFVKLVTRYLDGTDWAVTGAENIEDALRLVALWHPTAILLDVVIPDRDGWDFLQTLKRTPATRDVPVLICSVLDEPGLALTLGAAEYLLKPVTGRQLLEALDRAVRTSPEEEANV
ncbi:MAG: response regulator [Chloroflexi bacterium]|nr:response regulator [Chloroflexota bacterium]